MDEPGNVMIPGGIDKDVRRVTHLCLVLCISTTNISRKMSALLC